MYVFLLASWDNLVIYIKIDLIFQDHLLLLYKNLFSFLLCYLFSPELASWKLERGNVGWSRRKKVFYPKIVIKVDCGRRPEL
ncbi:hypothetical protein L6452_40379 [Arctium lappa]|uniref:Uncharacterized protein n=1 Tax=Arctium lappa TaxID=4217 RepID=A0ACB8XNI1_ARCLA|nr:hypothetical protein L6452_40379 [Arctium lappa]